MKIEKTESHVKEEMGWYEEVHRIRSNTNHYMVGINIFGRTEDGGWVPRYMNFNISDRASPIEDFKIERNILNDTDFFYVSTIKTLNQISEIYLKIMNKEKPPG